MTVLPPNLARLIVSYVKYPNTLVHAGNTPSSGCNRVAYLLLPPAVKLPNNLNNLMQTKSLFPLAAPPLHSIIHHRRRHAVNKTQDILFISTPFAQTRFWYFDSLNDGIIESDFIPFPLTDQLERSCW